MGELEPWGTVWGKSGFDRFESGDEWLPLWQHLDDSAGVVELLVRKWLSPLVIARLGREIDSGVDGVAAIAGWLAGAHDVGKASPAFAVQVPELTARMGEHGLVVDHRLKLDPERGAVNHALVGHVAVRKWLLANGFEPAVARQLGAIIGSHHGVTPDQDMLAKTVDRVDLAGGGPWVTAREGLLARQKTPPVLPKLSLPAQVLLSALVIVADWIASSPLFALWSTDTDPEPPDPRQSARRVADAWEDLALPRGWRAQPPGDTAMFDRFGRSTTRPVQRAAVEAAHTDPGLMIVEAPMGEGKTEAALLAAEVLASRTGADGCFIALPTQATSDAMFSRVRRWMDNLPGDALTLTLAHGKAHLNDEYTGLLREGRFTVVDGGATAHEWLSGRKKAGLAAFVVGTIDQVLFAGLRTKHLMLRHLALAGKVVIIDEVHAYDVYMSQYLHRVLHWLGAYGVPVVLLSATLPDARRAELLRAYAEGRGEHAEIDSAPGYPAITTLRGSTPVAASRPPSTVHLDRLDDTDATLLGYLREHLAEGGCAVVVRNTVGRVQDTAELLAAEFGADAITIAHSRFLACDRADIDRSLVRRFGPGDDHRPALHIVVASQVVEQSLDVDFDLMVTDLAPVDLVLQRTGRLHRHDRARPAPLREPRCALVGVEDWSAEPVVAVTGSRRVYGDHLLLRSAALLAQRAEVVLPGDISPLVQHAYGELSIGPSSWQPAMAEAARTAEDKARDRAAAAAKFLVPEATGLPTLTGWLHAGMGEAREEQRGLAQVRDGAESLEVLVVQRDVDGGLLLPDWIKGGGEQIPLHDRVRGPLAKAISACSLRLPLALSHGGVIDAVIAELERTRIDSFETTPLLRGSLVLVLDSDRRAHLHGYHLTYDPRRGLVHDRA